MPSSLPYGNINKLNLVTVVLSPASVAANTTAEQLFTVPGVDAFQDFVIDITKPTAQAGLGIVGLRVSGAAQVGVTFSNNTAAPIVPTAAQAYTFAIARRDGPAIGNMS
jgi:hypothetical protein